MHVVFKWEAVCIANSWTLWEGEVLRFKLYCIISQLKLFDKWLCETLILYQCKMSCI